MCMQGEYENACKHQKHLMVMALHIFRVIEHIYMYIIYIIFFVCLILTKINQTTFKISFFASEYSTNKISFFASEYSVLIVLYFSWAQIQIWAGAEGHRALQPLLCPHG